MPRLKRLLIALALAVGATVLAATVKVGDVFPDLTQARLEGELPPTAGKVVIVDFWASWCKPCKQSFPALNELHAKYAAQGLVILGLNEDERREDMEKFLKKIPAQFPVARDVEQQFVGSIRVRTMPSSFVLDRAGNVRYVHNGFTTTTKDELIAEIEALLKK